MTTTLFITCLTFLAMAEIAESICCEEIKSEVKKKTHAYETLCSKDTRLSANCCKEIEQEVKNYQEAYDDLCTATETCSNPQALGMESGKILNAAITASSTYSRPTYAPQNGRLRKKPDNCAWLPTNADTTSWLQVDFGNKTIVTGVATQGSCNEGLWVKSYVIQYSDDAANWKYYNQGGATKVFNGNKDQNTVVTNHFKPPILARYVRFKPKTNSGFSEMRVEYYGCRLEK